MDDLEVLAFQLALIVGAFCLGAVLGARDRRRLPPPDPKTNRNFGESS
jgi:hypothetical protein